MVPVAVMLNLRADALTAAQSSPQPVTNWCYSCPTDTARPCRHIRHGTSCASPHGQIAQLTLCQVTGEEIETATKLLEKACQKLRGIPEVPPQRITDLDNATRQLHQPELHFGQLQCLSTVKHVQLPGSLHGWMLNENHFSHLVETFANEVS